MIFDLELNLQNYTNKAFNILSMSLLAATLLESIMFFYNSRIITFNQILNIIAFTVGITSIYLTIWTIGYSVKITHISERNHATITDAYEFARKTTQSQTHLFHEFDEHLDWITKYLSPKNFSGVNTELYLGISTLCYGIGSIDKEIENQRRLNNHVDKTSLSVFRFLNFLESWTKHIEANGLNQTSIVHLTLWQPQIHANVFEKYYTKASINAQQYIREAIHQLEQVLVKLIDLYNSNYLTFDLFETDKSDSRLFLANDGIEYHGLMTIFTPLSEYSLEKKEWQLCGLSINNRQGFNQLKNFFNFLSKSNYDSQSLSPSLLHKHKNIASLIDSLFGEVKFPETDKNRDNILKIKLPID